MLDESKAPALDQFQSYLLLLARANVEAGARTLVDPNDLVQQTLLKAQQNLDQYRGNSDAELARWLRMILANNLTDRLRRAGRQLDEQALARRLEQSSVRLGQLLTAEQSTPSQQLVRNEYVQQLAEAMLQLPDDQRQAIELRHLQDLSLAEISTQMQRTSRSIAGLLQRGLKRLQETMRNKAD